MLDLFPFSVCSPFHPRDFFSLKAFKENISGNALGVPAHGFCFFFVVVLFVFFF